MAHKPKPFDSLYVCQTYRDGRSLSALERELGVSQSVLRKVLVAAGISIRTLSEALHNRWGHLDADGRRRLTVAAHHAVRGHRQSPEHRQRLAAALAESKRRSGKVAGRFESLLQRMLEDRGLAPNPQQPVVGYNLDLGLAPIAVEVHVCVSHPFANAKLRKRTKHLAEAGWHVLYVWITQASPLTDEAANQIVTLLDEAKRHPPAPGQYWVIRGSGEFATFRRNANEVALVMPPVGTLDPGGLD